MTTFRKSGIVVLLVAYVFTVGMGEVGHTDILPIIDLGGHFFNSPPDKAHTGQKDLDAIHSCQACYRTAQSVAYESSSLHHAGSAIYKPFVYHPQHLCLKLSELLRSFPKRGPPASFPPFELI
jgi:hypothetical protein